MRKEKYLLLIKILMDQNLSSLFTNTLEKVILKDNKIKK